MNEGTSADRPGLTVAMPAFNEVGNLESVVRDVLASLRSSGVAFEILVVDDGSTDGTSELADRLAVEIAEMRAVHHARNRGIGAAWRTCALASRGEWVFLQPADGQLGPSTALRFYGARSAGADVVVGTRGSWERPPYRRVLTLGYVTVVWLLLGVRLKGDHGACFLFRGDLLRSFSVVSGDRGIAVIGEWLYLTLRCGARVREEPAEVLPRLSGSSKTGRVNDTLATLVQLTRAAIVHRLLARATRPRGVGKEVVFVHPSSKALVQADHIGPGTHVWSNVVMLPGSGVGRECNVGKDVFIDAGVVVGDRVKIQNGVSLYRGVTVEDGVFFGPHCTTTNDLDPGSITSDGRVKGPDDWTLGTTLFRAGARIGAHATILCGDPTRVIGRWALVAAQALVTRDVPDFALVAGAPARFVRYVCPRGLRHPVEEREGGPYCRTCERALEDLVAG